MFKVLCKKINSCYLLMLILSFMGMLPSVAVAEGVSAPEQILVGVYVNSIHGINLKEDKFVADFYIWFKYKNDSLNPLKSFELKNGKIDSVTNFETHKEDGGLNHASARVVATVHELWDVSKYPFDKHELVLEIEDSDNAENKLVYTADLENSGVSDKAQTRGWKIDSVRTKILSNSYNTSYGDSEALEKNKSKYSNFSLSVDISRVGYTQFFKLFAVLFFSVFVAFLSFFIYANSAPRFTLGASALVATAANSFVVNSALPESSSFTLSDTFLISSLFFIFLSLATSTISMRVIRKGNEQLAQKIDRVGAILFLSLFMSCFFWVVCQF